MNSRNRWLSVALVACACGQQDVTREAWEQMQSEAPDEPRRVDNGDGTWSYALAEDFDPSVLVHGEIITWRYGGQARYSNAPSQGAPRTFVVGERETLDARERLFAMRRIDKLGRIWFVEDVDDDAWAAVRARAVDEDEDVSMRTSALEPEYAPGTTITWTPTTWDHQDCAPGGGVFSSNELHLWDGDGRNPDTTPSGRQRTAVQVFAGTGSCSGVIIDNDEVLTAAHCVSDDNNNPLPQNTVQVCKPDAWTCIGAGDIDFSPTYGGGSGNGGGTDFGDDWAIIELDASFSEGATAESDHMHLSTASDTTLASLARVHNISFPGFEDGCGSPVSRAVYHNAEEEPIAGIANNRLRLRIDGSPGQSGSPIYYCPAGDNDVCSGGDMGHVIGVMAGYDSVQDRIMAAKTAAFEAEAQAFIND